MVVSVNRFLNREEMTENAQYIMTYLLENGWTKNAIAGILGNMETESTINPGIWQNLDEGNTSLGFGLVQWTPATKLINWANSNTLDYRDIDTQLKRIQYEVDNGVQWIASNEFPHSFREFIVSTESPETLAEWFLINYERPSDQGSGQRNERRTQARYWFDNIEGGSGGGRPAFPTTEGLQITSPYGWRVNPITGERQFHSGIDIGGGGVEHPIYATQSGAVIFNGEITGGGWTIIIDHDGDPYFSRYLHMAVKSPIPIGTKVTKGQEIGTMGSTGDSTGIHLDFAIATTADGFRSEETTIDPELYLQMDFGDGDGGDSGNEDKHKILVSLLLCNALRGWS